MLYFFLSSHYVFKFSYLIALARTSNGTYVEGTSFPVPDIIGISSDFHSFLEIYGPSGAIPVSLKPITIICYFSWFPWVTSSLAEGL